MQCRVACTAGRESEKIRPRIDCRSLWRRRRQDVAEFKRRSHRKDPLEETRTRHNCPAVRAGGAAAISVLTEPDYFNGSLDDLREARHDGASDFAEGFYRR